MAIRGGFGDGDWGRMFGERKGGDDGGDGGREVLKGRRGVITKKGGERFGNAFPIMVVFGKVKTGSTAKRGVRLG